MNNLQCLWDAECKKWLLLFSDIISLIYRGVIMCDNCLGFWLFWTFIDFVYWRNRQVNGDFFFSLIMCFKVIESHMTGWIYLCEWHVSPSELCFLIFVIPTLLFGCSVVKTGGDAGRDTSPQEAGRLSVPRGILGQLCVSNIFLTRYLVERNTLLWNCMN